MIIVEVYSNKRLFGSPVATLSYSGRGTTVTIEAETEDIKKELTVFSGTLLGLTGQRLVSPDNRQSWMESLPLVDASVPYVFKIADANSDIIEEVENDNAIEEDTSDEDSLDEGDGGGGDSGDGGGGNGGGDIFTPNG